MTIPPILNLRDVEFTDWGHGERYAAQLGPIAKRIGAQKLGYRLVVLPPGKAAWPFHFHYVNEEMFFILEGTGTLRHGENRYPIQAGDVICAPPGPQTPHQIINTSAEALRYLAVSTMEQPDVFEYPDSGKFGVFVGAAPGGDEKAREFSLFAPKSAATNYWEGEE